jgi:glycosyltransferase involved in cell wall biosynthesis
LGQFSRHFAEEIMYINPPGLDVHFLLPRFTDLAIANSFKFVRPNIINRYFHSLNSNYHIWHSLNQLPSHFPNKNSKHILTIHDLNFLIEKTESKSVKYLKKLQANVDRAHAITTVSKTTQLQIEQYIDLKSKSIDLIYNGVKIDTASVFERPEFVKSTPFFFSIGIFTFKKNFHVLIPLMKHFPNYHLIIAGDNHTAYGSHVKSIIKNNNLQERVILPGNITEAQKCWLYKNCTAFFFPSLAEGFGLPIIEAMYFGKPVFLNRISSLLEIGSDVAFYYDDFDEWHMSGTIRDNLKTYETNQITLTKEIIGHAQKFSWNKSMLAYVNLYMRLL